ncbi:GntR family transcriptional regulator [Maritimibacter sp. 55A14]|uniref:MocR-like pyridoxine biosynthesis transcription factor PdxR n=1 Tax=Maritimibacter sp. 55A14 TaxID=2174844 RepID=UPI000D612EA9|nr:PLP-dependent aminotransferase family protein [Maritimibacter sp. 55A14]PWE33839.1 GntR family transcriptional regulator [Maritimibacter sp. 55A14]
MAISEDTFFLDPAHEGTLQSQIQQIVASAILSGRFRPGEKMPSSRRLARHLGVSRITVTLAYNELVADDYLRAADRSGYYISENAPTPPEGDLPPSASDDRVDWDRTIVRRYADIPLVPKPADWRSAPYPFVYGQVDPALFDQGTWRLCAHQALGRKAFDSLTADYADRDDAELVDFLLSHTLPRRGILARPGQVLITVGAQNALWLTAQLLLSPGRRAVIEDPCYPGLRASLAHTGCKVQPVPVDARGLPTDDLPAADVIFTTPSHQSPTAATMPLDRRRTLIRQASATGALIVEDDYEFEMSFLGPPAPALKSLDTEGRVIYIGSFSKSLFPGLRLGYMVASEPFIAEARAMRSAVLRHPPGHMQRTTAYFLARGHYDALIHRMRDAFHQRRRIMDRALAQHGILVAGKAAFGGTSYWIEGPAGLDAEDLAARLAPQGVLFDPGRPFFAASAPPRNFFRLAYSSIAADRIPEGIARLAQAMKD